MKRRRREVLLGAVASAAAVASLPAPAIAQGIKELKLVTGFPKDLPESGTSPERLAKTITVDLGWASQGDRLPGRQSRQGFGGL